MGGRSLALFLIGSIFGRISTDEHRHQREQEPLVSGVEKINMVPEDSIVYLALLFPDGSVDLEARSLIIGVGCNAPGFSPKLDLLVILFLHHHAHRIFLATKKLLLLNPILILQKLSEKFYRDSRLYFQKLFEKISNRILVYSLPLFYSSSYLI